MEFELSPLWISLKTAFAATFITFFLGITAARWMLGYQGKYKGIIEGILISPLVLPPTVVGFLLLLLFGNQGPIGQLLLQLNINIIFSWPATIITATVVAFPLMYKTALGAFEQIDRNLISAARTLGASEWKVFWRVYLPLALPGIIAGTILAFTRALGEFGATLMLAGNIPGKTQTIPVAIYFAVEAGDMQQSLIWVSIILIISLSVLTAVNYLSKESIHKEIWKIKKYKNSQLSMPPASCLIPNYQLTVNIQKQLSDFSLSVNFNLLGETLAVLGGSGAGKTMLLRCIAGLENPSQGQIILNGRVLFDSKTGINLSTHQRRVGFLFQNYALFPHMTVAENIGFGLTNLSKIEINRRVKEQLALVQLPELANRYTHELSGGQQQRVALARALAIGPEILLLDEPFSALDTYLRTQMEMQLIETLSNYQGVTLLVTHNLEEAYRICQNLLVISQGKVAAYDRKEAIFEHPRNFIVAQLTGCKNFSRVQIEQESVAEIYASDWSCTLRVIQPIPQPLAYVGIRAHHFTFLEDNSRENTFSCWVAQTSETPHRMTLFLKLHAPASNAKDYHFQAEVFKEKWVILKDRPLPWYIHLDPSRLFLMEE